MRYLLSWYSFVCWLSMWGCVPFEVEADSLPNWVCGDALAFEWKQIRLLFEIEEMRYLLSWYSFICWLSLWWCVPFWVEASSFADWVCGDAFLLSRSKFVCWLSMWGCVPFWLEADSFADWVCGNALTFEWKEIRLLFEIEGMRYLLSWYSFVCWLSVWGCVPF